MNWALIIIAAIAGSDGAGVSVQTKDFATQQLCQVAADQLDGKAYASYNGFKGATVSIISRCVQVKP